MTARERFPGMPPGLPDLGLPGPGLGPDDLEGLMETYRRQREELEAVQVKIRSLACTAVAPRRTVSVTAGYGGEVTDITFPTAAYKRLPPAELAAAVTATVRQAQALATAEAAELLAPSMPEGVDVNGLLAGTVDLSSLLPVEPGLRSGARDAAREG